MAYEYTGFAYIERAEGGDYMQLPFRFEDDNLLPPEIVGAIGFQIGENFLDVLEGSNPNSRQRYTQVRFAELVSVIDLNPDIID